jgi:hypothetical protein
MKKKTLFFWHKLSTDSGVGEAYVYAVAAPTKEKALGSFKKFLPKDGWKKTFIENDVTLNSLFEAHQFWAKEVCLEPLAGNWNYTVKQLKDAYAGIVKESEPLLKERCGKVLRVYFAHDHN